MNASAVRVPPPPTGPSLLSRWWPCLLVLFLAVLIRVPLINLEFGRNGDGTGSFYGVIARNYLLRDNSQTWWMPVISVGPAASPPTVYAHHPPLVPLLCALSLGVLGEHDWALRLPAAFFTFATVALLFAVLRDRLGPLAAAAAASAFAFVPMSLRFGQMPDVINTQLVFAGLLIATAYVRLLEHPTPERLAALVAALCFGFLTDWPAFYFVPLILLHLALARPSRWKTAAAVIFALSVIAFAILVVWASLASGRWDLILHQFLNRVTRSQTDDLTPFSWGTWLSTVATYNLALHTWPLLLLAPLGLITLALPPAASTNPRQPHGGHGLRTLVLLIVAWAVLHVIVGRQATINHDWWWWPMTLALTVCAACLAARIARFPAGRFIVPVAIVALCGYWSVREIRHLLSPGWVHGAIADYTPRQLGTLVRGAVPPGTPILLFDADEQPYLYWYADRPILQRVWDSPTFDAALAAREADLYYNFRQALTAPPALFVFPKTYLPKGQYILPRLQTRYPTHDAGPFLTFDLTRSLPSPPP